MTDRGSLKNLTIDRRSVVAGTAAVAIASSLTRRARAQEPRAKIRIGVVPLISSSPLFYAKAKGYFDTLNLDVEFTNFADSVLALPALIAGELDVAVGVLTAGFFNAAAKGAPYKMMLDRGAEKPGSGSMTIAASNAMVAAGMTSPDKFSLLKGKTLAIQGPGGIDQYLLGRAAQKAGLDPRTDVEWKSGLAYPDIVKLMGAGQCDAANIPVPLGFLVERNNFGKLVFAGFDVEPNAQLACWAISEKFLSANKSAAVRFAMAHTYAARMINKAAAAKDAEAVKIIAEATRIPANLIEAAAPRWTWFAEDGMPNIDSCMSQGRFWVDTMKLASGTVTKEKIFDLSPAIEANERLTKSNPFG